MKPEHSGVDDDPDLELIRRVASGDAAACAALVDRHLRKVTALATRLLGNAADAAEVAQDVFLRAWTQAANWQEGRGRWSTWLYRVTLNLCQDRLRRRRPQETWVEEVHGDATPGPGEWLARREREALLARALAELPERQREALVLFHYEGLSQTEAARVMEISVDALESLLARARRQLRARLAGALVA